MCYDIFINMYNKILIRCFTQAGIYCTYHLNCYGVFSHDDMICQYGVGRFMKKRKIHEIDLEIKL